MAVARAPMRVAPVRAAPMRIVPMRVAAPRVVARAPVARRVVVMPRYAPVVRRTVAPRFVARRAVVRAPVRVARVVPTRVVPRTVRVARVAPARAVPRTVRVARVAPARVAARTVPARNVAARNAAIAARRRRGLPPVAESTQNRRFRRAAAVGAAGVAAEGARRPFVASRDPNWHNWDHGREHFWHHHHFRWFNGAWIIVDPGFYAYGYPYGYGYPYPDLSSYDTGYAYPEAVGESTVTGVQSQLAQQGYYSGSIDGIIGAETRAAIRRYQRDHGLSITGTITPDLISSLGL